MTKVENFSKYIVVALLAGFLFACSDSNTNSSSSSTSPASSSEEKTDYPAGKTIYQKTCISCHNNDGNGVAGMYPPLAKSDFLLADKNRAIHQVLHGSNTKYTVNGADYSGSMPPQGLSDEETAQVLNYVLHAWGNNGPVLNAADVKAVRDTIKK